MTNKPQSEMPEIAALFPSRLTDRAGKYTAYVGLGKKYFSEQSHLAALAELEAKHREELSKLQNHVATLQHKRFNLFKLIKQRIGEKS